MRQALNAIGYLAIVFGTIWFFQGINVLPGSFMTGQIKWAVYGGIAVATGIVMLVVASRLRKQASADTKKM